jgi:hypothetical protein
MILSSLVFSAQALLAQVPHFGPGPKIEFSNRMHDYGKIQEEDHFAVHRFEFTNTGDKDLYIQRVESSCGCTTPAWTEGAIPPGGSGFVETSYETTGRIGTFSKSVTVYCNAVNTSFVHLDIRGEVVREGVQHSGVEIPDLGRLEFDKPSLSFDPLFDNRIDTQSIRITNSTPYSTHFTTPSESELPPYIRIVQLPSGIEPGQSARILIAVDGSALDPYGFGATQIPLMTDNPVMPYTGIYVTYNRKQYFPTYSERQLKKLGKLEMSTIEHQFGPVVPGDIVETHFVFKNTGKGPLQIKELFPECGCLSLESSQFKIIGTQKTYPTATLAPGESLDMLVRFNTAQKTGYSNQSIWVVTNDPRNPEFRLRVGAILPEPKTPECLTCPR